MKFERIYYELFGREIQCEAEDKARIMPYEPCVSWAVHIEDNNILFLEMLDKKIKEGGPVFFDMWLRGLLSSYVKRCSRENEDSPYLREYYIEWLNNTRLIINGKYPAVKKWCDEYEAFIQDLPTFNDLCSKYGLKKSDFPYKYSADEYNQILLSSDSFELMCESFDIQISSPIEKNDNIVNSDNPQPTQEIDEALNSFFKSTFKGKGYNTPNYFEYLIEDLKVKRSDIDFARIAFMIYNSDKMNPSTKPKTFKDWYEHLCKLTGNMFHKDYKPSKLKPTDSLKKKLYYLF